MPHRQNALVVSLHDVSPLTLADSRQILGELESLGVGATSLLVIPNHHSRGHFQESPELRSWLTEVVSKGHEPVIHGYLHRRERAKDETILKRLTTRIYTADEGEFYDIGADRARDLISRALSEFRESGLKPCGFIAPAWLLSDEGEAVIRELGFRYTTRLGSVTDFQAGHTISSQSLVWSVRSAWRRICSLLWNRYLFARLQPNELMRISIHPVDRRHPAIWKQILDLIRAATALRTPVTYADFLKERPDQSLDLHTQAVDSVSRFA